MNKRRNVFKPLAGIDAKNKEVSSLAHSNNERWLFGVLPADKEAPNIEDEKPEQRFRALFILIFVLFFILFGRTFYLQVVTGNESLNLAQENRFRVQSLRAPRGILYDRNKKPLVKNIPNYEVTAIPSDLPKVAEEKETVINRLAETIEMDAAKINKILEDKDPFYTQPVLISKSVTRETSLIFESRQSELKGFYVGINPIREYLDNGLLSHTLGYVGRISEKELENNKDYKMTDFIGKSGLEGVYENILKGVDGKQRIEVDSTGEIIRIYGQENPTLGDNILLTVDIDLQKKLTEEMTRQMKIAKVNKGAAVAINPQNGEVLAIVSLPTYDNNLFANGISEKDYAKMLANEDFPLVNRVTAGEYPSGSTIKPFLSGRCS
jgi:penicillin-binding protein 2